ncbi:hypothetical protein C0J52_28119 [Blattella germanica]|nr:hypothetical protein C0J52_28119 [Blattella germanica]
MATSWTMKVLLSHPIGAPGWWKASTFGGEVGMNVIKEASLRSLICNNLKSKCHGIDVRYSVPRDILQENLREVYEKEIEKFVSKRRHCALQLSSSEKS